jgi:excisionase family DNA binding protein
MPMLGILKEPEEREAIMNVREVAAYLRISEAKVYRLAKEGGIPTVRIGKAWRFKKDLLDQWIRQNTEASMENFGENVCT